MTTNYERIKAETSMNVENVKMSTYFLCVESELLKEKPMLFITGDLTWELCINNANKLELNLESFENYNASVEVKYFSLSCKPSNIFNLFVHRLQPLANYIHFYPGDEEFPTSVELEEHKYGSKVIIEIRVLEEDHCAKISRTPLHHFHNMLRKEKMADVTFLVDNKQIKAHKVILAARSPIFSSMFELEKLDKKENEITIEEESYENFYAMLEFMYSGKFVDSTALELLPLAEKYQISDLKAYCEDFLKQNINISNAVKSFILADCYKINDLKEEAGEFIVENFKKIVESDKFKNLVQTNTQLAEEIFELLATKKC